MGTVTVAALVSVLVPVLAAGSARAAGTPGAVPGVAWHTCPAGSAGAVAGGFLCATVAAPLDYQDPSGPKIRLAVVEHVATGPAPRGVIFFNPGGPGGPGTVELPAYIGFWPKDLRGRGKRVPRPVRRFPRWPGPAGRLHPPVA
jgi:hypothetical protein